MLREGRKKIPVFENLRVSKGSMLLEAEPSE